MFPTNRTLQIQRKGALLSTVQAHVEPSRPEVKALLGVPAAKVFDLYIPGLPDVREQDMVVSTDPAESYRVIAAEQFDVDLVRHTHLVAEGKWGS